MSGQGSKLVVLKDMVTGEQVRRVTLYVDELTSRHGNKLYARRDMVTGEQIR